MTLPLPPELRYTAPDGCTVVLLFLQVRLHGKVIGSLERASGAWLPRTADRRRLFRTPSVENGTRQLQQAHTHVRPFQDRSISLLPVLPAPTPTLRPLLARLETCEPTPRAIGILREMLGRWHVAPEGWTPRCPAFNFNRTWSSLREAADVLHTHWLDAAPPRPVTAEDLRVLARSTKCI